MLRGYMKYGGIEDAKLLHDKMPQINAVTWNTMISDYAQKYCFNDSSRIV
jgi:PPR repeat